MNNIRKVVPILTIVTLLSKVFGAGRDLVLSYYYGSTCVSDAYLLATTIPVTIFSFIYEGIGATFIPACTRLTTKIEQNRFTSNLINILIIISSIIVIIIELFPRYAIIIFASGFDDGTMKMASKILQISVTGVLFSAVAYVFVSYLNYNNLFIRAAARAIPMDIVVIISIVLSAKYESITILSIGIVISLLVALLFLLPDLNKAGWHYYKTLDIRDSNIRSVFTWSLPVVVSMALADINSIVDRQFASHLTVGGISSITYSTRLISIVSALFFAPLLTVLFPDFSKSIQEGKISQTKNMVGKALRHLMIISLPILIYMFIMSPDIINVVFERGAFNSEASRITAGCLKYYSLSILASALIMVTTKVFYSFANMWTPMKISAIGVVINVIGNFILTHFMGLSGLALSSSVSLSIVALLQIIIISNKLNLSKRELLLLFVKVLGIVGFIAILIWVSQILTDSQGLFIRIVSSLLIVLILYPILLYVFGVHESSFYYKLIKSYVLRVIKR